MGMRQHARHAVARATMRATRRRATAGAGIRIRDLDTSSAGARGAPASRANRPLQNEYATESTYYTGRIYPQ